MTRRATGQMRGGFLLSAVIHLALGGLIWWTSSRTEREPAMRVYAVNIVSPPPQEQGPPTPEPEPEPPAREEPEPEPEPEEPEPEAPAPEPEPEPEPPPPTPAERTPEPEPEPEPAPPEPEEEPEPEPEEPTPEPEPERTATTGARPDPNSTGGEDIDLQLPGVQCPTPDYCNNIIRQINRYFRHPGGSGSGTADVYFAINRDGSIDGLKLLSSSGSSSFRIAVLEAVEQAGIARAFGPLPPAYQADQLPVSFFFRPAR